MSSTTDETKIPNNDNKTEPPINATPTSPTHIDTKTDVTDNTCMLTSIDISNLNIDSKYDDDEEDTAFTPLELSDWASIDEEIMFANHGYKKLDKICDIIQGELFKAIQLSNNKYVAIKKTDKTQFQKSITISNGFSFCVTENRVKESTILKYLTVYNKPIGEYIVRFINFFDSETHYYLVTEYINTDTNLHQFTKIAHKYMTNGLLTYKTYKQIIKYILWQLAVTIKWLHVDMKCTHLDIVNENIMLENCNFVTNSKGKLQINPAISIKICDFGVAELFKPDRSMRSLKKCSPFRCQKQNLTLDNESYLAPEICKDEYYDARLADVWSFGMVYFECITGQKLYNSSDVWQCLSHTDSEENVVKNGYFALMNGGLKQYLATHNLLKCFNVDSFDLLNKLLNMNENKRINAYDVLKHKWFGMYYKRYRKQIEAKSVHQHKHFIENKALLKGYQFYCLTNDVTE